MKIYTKFQISLFIVVYSLFLITILIVFFCFNNLTNYLMYFLICSLTLFLIFTIVYFVLFLFLRYLNKVEIKPYISLYDRLRILAKDELPSKDEPFEIIDKDLTAIEKRQIKLQIQNDKLDYIINKMAQGLILIDHHQRIALINQAAKQIFHIQDSSPDSLIYLTNYPSLLEACDKASEKLSSFKIDFKADNKDYIVDVYTIDSGLNHTHKYFWVCLCFIDITPLKQLENVKRDFFANASHELKSPLTSIIGYSQLLNEGFISDEKEKDEAVNRIIFEAERMSKIVREMLTLSNYEFENQLKNLTDIKLKDLIIQICNEMKLKIEQRNLKFEFNLEDIKVKMNSDDAYYLFKNLIENAINYNKDNGEVKIELTKKYFKISDTGIGIAKENQQRIFERFFRVDKAKSKKEGGTGLGLAIVKHVIQIYNFKLTLDSELNKGSTFTVFF